MNTTFRDYMNEIIKIPLCTKDEAEKLFLRVKNGDTKAREELIERNLRLVVKVAYRYNNCGLPLIDIIGYGNIGLIKAVDSFNADKGYSFSTYAVFKIRKEITLALDKMYSIKEQLLDDENNLFDNLKDEVDIEDAVINNTVSDYIDNILSHLNERQKKIIINYYGLHDLKPMSQSEIGIKEGGLSKQNIGQIKGRSLKKMKKYAKNHQLDDYLKNY